MSSDLDELEERIKKSKGYLNELENKMKVIEYSIIEKALSKINSYIQFIFALFSGLIIFIGFVTWATGDNLETFYKNIFQKEMDNWLTFSDKNSPISKEMKQIRVETMINANLIKLEKNSIDEYSVRVSELNLEEKTELMNYLSNPDLLLSNFIDGLKVLKLGYGPYSINFEEKVEEKNFILNILNSNNFTSYKKLSLIENLNKSINMLPYSISVLNNSDINYSWKVAAFETVSLFNKQFALDYAKSTLRKYNSSIKPNNEIYLMSHLGQIIKLIAMEDPNAFELKEFIDKHSYLTNQLLEIAFILAQNEDNSNLQVHDLLFKTLNSAIHNNAFLDIHSFFNSKYISTINENIISKLDSPDKLFNNIEILNELVKKNSEIEDLLKVIKFFQIVDRSYYIVAIQLSLSEGTIFTFLDNSTLQHSDVKNDMLSWLIYNDSTKSLELSWRDCLGNINQKTIKKVKDIQKSKLYFSYDKKIMENLSIRKFNNLKL
ncbi:hypothetical protein AVENP_2635 [Arcobacter venerupis]|uniref:Uncharacterized protein n=1 Tax=Arcobacter venerupis TaxID=1054033 RepID=A0AAE7BAD4_9BACT|nr:hypothetical protein [Arcobacter venerupis]QKF68131.1 hypothetical protein AVENP_2635 [Arcobacter venerupis]RWS48884.1 hypothetical protein CKA56_12160 [Arcobacter venerupis]